MQTLALVNGRVLVGDVLVEGHSVLIEEGRILDVVPDTHPRCRLARKRDLAGQRLLPGFIDCQVNGGGGVLFNDAPTVETIRTIARAHRRFGTTGFLPTLISDDLAVVERAIAAVRQAIQARVPGVLGIHIEGPFLSLERRGIHHAGKLRRLDEGTIELLTSLGVGRTLVTLAPEMTTPALITRLTQAGVIVSCGHSNATHAQVREALQAGVSCFTHLFNAMSPLTAREPGVVGAALEDPHSWCGIIVDGRHVNPVTLRLALRARGSGRFVLVTDAMPSVGTALDSFVLQGQEIRVKDNVCVDAEGRLAGSHIDMAGCVRNAVRLLGLRLPVAVAMASRHPAELLGLAEELGGIAQGQRANLVLVDEELQVLETWIDGRESAADRQSTAVRRSSTRGGRAGARARR